MPSKVETEGEPLKNEKVGGERTVDTPETVTAVKTSPPWPLITIGVVASFVILAIIIGGSTFIHAHFAAARTQSYGRYGLSQQGGASNGGGFRRGGMMQAAAVRGVITAVNGNTLTVAGEGKSTTVTKSDSTTISGDKTAVAVDDTVVVYGTTGNDGSVSATRIVVRNEAPGGVSGSNSDYAVPGA